MSLGKSLKFDWRDLERMRNSDRSVGEVTVLQVEYERATKDLDAAVSVGNDVDE